MSSVIKINKSNHSAGLKLQNFNNGPGKNFESEDEYWNKKIEKAKQEAFAEAKEAALIEMESRFSQELLSKYGEFENLVFSIEEKFSEYENAYEKIVTQLSISIAEKIAHRKLEEDSMITEVIKESSQKILGADKILIKVNPSDYELLRESGRELFRDESFSKVQFESDPKIELGGCFIESEIGNVDARISTQINEITQQITNNYLNDSNQ